MSTKEVTAENNGYRYGMFTGIVLIAYMILAALLGFFDNILASGLNLLILTVGIVLAIRNLHNAQGASGKYLAGYGTAVITAGVASAMVGVAFVIFSLVMPDKMGLTRLRDLFGFDLSLVMSFCAIILSGAMWAAIIAIVAMQFHKDEDPMHVNEIE